MANQRFHSFVIVVYNLMLCVTDTMSIYNVKYSNPIDLFLSFWLLLELNKLKRLINY